MCLLALWWQVGCLSWLTGIQQYQEIEQIIRPMKASSFALVDAHIIGCRLHHHNTLVYSVALKSNKEQLVSTPFYPPQDLTIPLDHHLTLPVDKYTYEQFPKLTLIVNVMADNNDRKTVGTTFANFRKQGIQTFKISECSCKDKAFEVDICFTSKIIDPKSSNHRSPKNQHKTQLKSKYLSQQGTPRESRLLPNDAALKGLKQQQQGHSPAKVYSAKAIGSDKKTKTLVETHKNKQGKGYEPVYTQSRLQYDKIVAQILLCQQQLYQCKTKNEDLQQLLRIEEERTKQAADYIQVLQQALNRLLPTHPINNNPSPIANPPIPPPLPHHAPLPMPHHAPLPMPHHAPLSMALPIGGLNGLSPKSSFKVIQQMDQIILMNEDLQNELQRERQKVKVISAEAHSLEQGLRNLERRLIQTEMQLKSKEESEKKVPATEARDLVEFEKILLSSRCYAEQVKTNEKCPKQQCLNLVTEIAKLQDQTRTLTQQMAKLQAHNCRLHKQLQKQREDARKQAQTAAKHSKKQPSLKKTERPANKEKPFKSPPLKASKNQPAAISAVAQNHNLRKAEQQVSKSTSSTGQKTKVSTQNETKTQPEQSLAKSSNEPFNQLKSELKAEVNAMQYYANTFQDEVPNF